MPESTRVLIKELQGLAIDVTLFDEKGDTIDMNTIAEDAERESRRIHHEIVNFDTRKEERDEMERARNAHLEEEEYETDVEDNQNPEPVPGQDEDENN